MAESVSPITPAEQEHFITGLLASVGTYIGPPSDGERKLKFHEPFTGDHPQLFNGEFNKRAVFRAVDRKDSEHVEYFTFGNPIIETIVQEIIGESFPGATGTRSLYSAHDLSEGAGWLFLYQLTIPGIRERQVLSPVFVGRSGTPSEAIGEALVKRACRLEREHDIPVEAVPLRTIDEASEIAEGYVGAKANVMQTEAQWDAETRADIEMSRMNQYFEYRERASKEKVVATAAVLDRLKESADSGQRRIVPLWEANLERAERVFAGLAEERTRRVELIERSRNPVVDYQLLSAGWVQIVSVASQESGEEPHE